MPHSFRVSVLALLATIVPGVITAQDAGKPDSAKPNIILILSDDMDYCDLGVTSGTKTATPNIDSIGKNGVSFSNGYVTCPVCGPSRVGILTGMYQDRTGFVTNHGPKIPENFGLPGTYELLPESLKKAGYATGMIGKWHLGFDEGMTPNDQGFDYYFGHLHGAHDYNPGVEKPGPILRNKSVVKTTKYLTTELGDEASSFVLRANSPYFLYVAFNAVHDPLQAPDDVRERFKHIPNERDRIMAAMLYEMDNAVGSILKAVRDKGQEDNTIIIFTNDNGGPRGHLPEANGVLRGGKGMVYEGGIRVPMFIQWKGKIAAGSQYSKPVIALDFAPTLLAAANTTSTARLEGKNLLPYISGENAAAPHDKLFWSFVDAPNQKAARSGDWKIVQPRDNAPWELYNLADDIGETKDLAQQHPDIVKSIRSDWQSWNKENVKPLWLDPRIVNKRKQMNSETSGTDNLKKRPAKRRASH